MEITRSICIAKMPMKSFTKIAYISYIVVILKMAAKQWCNIVCYILCYCWTVRNGAMGKGRHTYVYLAFYFSFLDLVLVYSQICEKEFSARSMQLGIILLKK